MLLVQQRLDDGNRASAADTALVLNYDITESLVIVKENKIFRVSTVVASHNNH